jgi:hypothetical protein
MADPLLTTSATLTCQHGGVATIVPAQTAASAGAVVCTEADLIVFSGCLNPPGGPPSPCFTIQWKTTSRTCVAGGQAVLTTGSAGICTNAAGAPQGPVKITPAQTRASAS